MKQGFFSQTLYFFLSFLIIVVNLIWFLPTVSSIRRNVGELELAVAEKAASTVSAFLNDVVTGLKIPARYLNRDLKDPSNASVVQKILKEEYFTKIVLTGKDGGEIFKYDKFKPVSADELGSVAGEEVFEEAMRSLSPRFGSVRISEKFEPVVTVVFPLSFIEGEASGALIAELGVSRVFSVISDIKVAGRGGTYLVDGTGLLLAHSDISLVFKNLNYSSRAIVADVLKRKEPVVAADNRYAYVNEDGVPVLSAAAYVPEVGWAVVVEEPRREALTSLRTIEIFAFIVVVIGIVLIFILRKINIDLVRTEKKLRESLNESRKLAAIVEASSEGVAFTDAVRDSTKFLYVNPAWEKMTGWRREEVLDKESPRILKSGRQNGQFYKRMWETISAGKTFVAEFVNRRKDGSFYDSEVVIFPINDERGNIAFYAEVSRDVTLRKEVERRVKEAFAATRFERDKLETILKSMGDGAFVVNAAGLVVLFNPVAETISGYSASEVLGRHYSDVLKFVLEENGNSASGGFINDVFKTGKVSRMSNHTILITKDGERRPVADSAAPIFDEGGRVAGCVVVFRDVAKEREIDRIKSEFISLASHQLRTPLTAIKWFLEISLAGEAGKLTAKQKDFLKSSYDSAVRMGELITALLNLSRIESRRLAVMPKLTDVAKATERLVAELKPQIEKKKHSVTVSAAPDLPFVTIDEELLHEILTNFLTNSVKYTPDGGKIETKISLNPENADEVIFEVKDNGLGIPAAQQQRVFDKFFRADNVVKTTAEGTGLGLYLVSRLAETLGGRVWFESAENRGASFFFAAPIKGVKGRKGEKGLAG